MERSIHLQNVEDGIAIRLIVTSTVIVIRTMRHFVTDRAKYMMKTQPSATLPS